MKFDDMNWEEKAIFWKNLHEFLGKVLKKYKEDFYEYGNCTNNLLLEIYSHLCDDRQNVAEQMNSTKLKNCPFCGGEVEFVPLEEGSGDYEAPYNYIHCLKCGFQTGNFTDALEAARVWNKRVSEK